MKQVAALELRSAQKGLELNFQAEPGVPPAVVGDLNRLWQIVVNLVGNGIKFSERGEVTMRVASQVRDEETVTLHFSIQDTGIGIPEEKQQVIFGAFSQAESSVTRRYGGTGLGLTISRRPVEMMGARLWLESVLGEGSTFHFTVRLRLGRTVEPEPEMRSRRLIGSGRRVFYGEGRLIESVRSSAISPVDRVERTLRATYLSRFTSPTSNVKAYSSPTGLKAYSPSASGSLGVIVKQPVSAA